MFIEMYLGEDHFLFKLNWKEVPIDNFHQKIITKKSV